MTFRLRESDCQNLACLADYRILTVPQMAAVFQKDKQVIRRRFGALEKQGFIEVIRREFGRSRGRPENVLGLTERGADLIREQYLADQDIPYESLGPVSTRLMDHQTLLNWFRIHFQYVSTVQDRLGVRCLAYNSPFVPRGPEGRLLTTDMASIAGRKIYTRTIKYRQC
ncbi:MAG: replication-relaxation family protein [Sedimentisphaerales bacterium]|nr:replication-relaxation family protein [Sedimentisphaerales bacterium]